MVSRRLIVIARIYLGIIFAVAAASKMLRGVDFEGSMLGFLSAVTARQGFGWYAAFVRGVVLPHASLFANLVLAAECVVAVGLLFGLLTRVSAALAIFLLLNYLFAKGAVPWSPGSNDTPDIVLATIVVLGNGGRAFGLDRYLHEKFPRVPLF